MPVIDKRQFENMTDGATPPSNIDNTAFTFHDFAVNTQAGEGALIPSSGKKTLMAKDSQFAYLSIAPRDFP